MSRKKKITNKERITLLQMWPTEKRSVIAHVLGITENHVYRVARDMGLPPMKMSQKKPAA